MIFSIGKIWRALDNLFRDKNHGVWVGTRGLGNQFVPQLANIYHAAIWI